MRAKFLGLLLLCFTGCATISTLNNNMTTMNDTIQENIETMEVSGQKIDANTAEVIRSTNQAEEFKKIISSNTDSMKNGIDGVKKHTGLFPIVFIALVALLFLPTAICLVFYHKFFQHMRPNSKR